MWASFDSKPTIIIFSFLSVGGESRLITQKLQREVKDEKPHVAERKRKEIVVGKLYAAERKQKEVTVEELRVVEKKQKELTNRSQPAADKRQKEIVDQGQHETEKRQGKVADREMALFVNSSVTYLTVAALTVFQRRPMLVTFINNGYISLTNNWLCHTRHLEGLHQNMLILAQVSYAYAYA